MCGEFVNVPLTSPVLVLSPFALELVSTGGGWRTGGVKQVGILPEEGIPVKSGA